MRLSRKFASGFTLVETVVAVGIGTLILAALTVASVALQRSFMAIEDYAKGQNDQMRISDYLSLDMRRAYSIGITGDSSHPPLTVTLSVPNFYQSADTPYDPHIAPITGWLFKKHHHNKHQDIILNQVVNYGPVNDSAPTLTVTYVFDNSAYTLTRNVNGVATTIATDVKDFNVSISDLDETAQTQITFNPRFRTLTSSAATQGTTYFQTTLTRNTR
jgi:type II secretory pathway component PulJ